MEELCGALVDLSTLGDIIDYVLVEHIHAPHLLVDQGQVLDILCGILDHSLSQGSLLPKLNIILHLTIDFIFLRIYLADIFF